MTTSQSTLRPQRVRPARRRDSRATGKQPLPSERRDYDLDHSVGYLLNRTARIIAARFSDDLRSYDINLQEWRVLSSLRHEHHQSLSDLASHTGSELSYLSRAVGTLESKGYIHRSACPSDRRNLHLSLTPKGIAIVNELSPRAWEI